MIYDCFQFFNELPILLIRLKYLDDTVDKFVITEGTKTHSGNKKDLIIKNNWHLLKEFHHKIIYIVVDNYPEFHNSWTYENFQRNELFRGLKNCCDNDLILISDVDEIPNKKKIPNNILDGEIYLFIQRLYLYYANTYVNKHLIWEGGTKILNFRTIKKNLYNKNYVKYHPIKFPKYLNEYLTPTKIRLYRNPKLIFNGGWHLSWLGGVNNIKLKLDATSHQEINNPNNAKSIEQSLEKGIDLLTNRNLYIDIYSNNIPTVFKGYEHLFLKSGKIENKYIFKLKLYLEILLIGIKSLLRPLKTSIFK
jgi:beta-1,4-mannosyl-glycoprotein beta-1,4-N-acetylglucosaminyltransferase